ncbi:MAG TPA: AI-2E family transporter [Candidatus Hydrogenedentes bacterium]|nr:AI-2E family transporter [Candidatus Hydrogenedentota bacterium]HPG65325.1 AI-2E family transporter [Candidatus Hydrogenedentota bacterium]
MLKTVFGNPWIRAIGLLLAAVAFVALCVLLRSVLVPLLLAFLVAYVLDPVVDALERKGVRRTVSIGAIAALAIMLLASIPIFLVPRIISQAEGLVQAAKNAGQAQDGMAERVTQLFHRLPLDDFVRAAGWVEPDATEVDARAVVATEVGNFVIEHATSFLKTFANTGAATGKTVANVFSSIGRGTVGVLLFIGNFVLFTFVAGYLLKDFNAIIRHMKDLVPLKHRDRVFRLVAAVDAQIHGFLRGQALVCACLGVMYSIGLTISGVPFGVVIGVFGGVASFVPYLGFILAIGPAIVLALLQHGLSWHVIGVVATFTIAQSVEGSVLTPKIVGDQVGLNPVWVILAIMAFSTTLGFLGLLLAVPMAAALKVLVVEAVDAYQKSAFFRQQPPPTAPVE